VPFGIFTPGVEEKSLAPHNVQECSEMEKNTLYITKQLEYTVYI
jgi:hypothetical protein